MIEQGSHEWHLQRVAKVTASRLADVMATIKTGEAASRINYKAQLVAERLTGSPSDSFSNAAMAWGTEQEPNARMAYEAFTGELVDQVSFIDHPTIANSGASPDGLVGEDGLIEIKCPNTATHIDTLLHRNIPNKYLLQMQWQMTCTGRQWCDFVSYDPRMPERLQLCVIRVTRDNDLIAECEYKVREFLAEVDNLSNQLGEL